MKITKEIRQDLYTQTKYAAKVGLTVQAIASQVKHGKLSTVHVHGTVLIKAQ